MAHPFDRRPAPRSEIVLRGAEAVKTYGMMIRLRPYDVRMVRVAAPDPIQARLQAEAAYGRANILRNPLEVR